MSDYEKNKNKRQIFIKLVGWWKKISWREDSAGRLILLLIFMFGFLYLTQVNATATKGFIIRDLEKKLETSKNNNLALELDVRNLQSVGGLQDKVAILGMVPVKNIEYLSSQSGVVAMR